MGRLALWVTSLHTRQAKAARRPESPIIARPAPMLHSLNAVVEQWVAQWGYLGIFAAMVLENVIPPIPSELIMPLAASACLGQGQVEFRLCSVSLHARGTEAAISSLARTVVFKQQLD